MQRPSRSVATILYRSGLAILFAGLVNGPLVAAAAPQFDDLIAGLDAVELETRIEATSKLAELGVQAVEPVAEAATAGSLEATRRAMEVLETMRASSDEQVQAAALKALEKLASGDHRPSARRAQAILNPAAHVEATVDAPETAQVLLPGVNGNIQIAGGGRIQIAAGNGRVVQQIQINNVNGNLKKSIEVVEGQRRVQIEEQPGQITVTITTKKDGKEEKQVIQAPNADALKKQNPEIHKIYEKFGGQAPANAQGAIQGRIQFRAQAIPGQAIPAQRIQIQRNIGGLPQRAVPAQAIPGQPIPAQGGIQNLPPQIQQQIQQRLQQQLKRAQERREAQKEEAEEAIEE